MSAKCHENKCKDKHHAKYQHFAFCSFTVLNELKERLIAVWSYSNRTLLILQLTIEENVSRHVSVQMVDILNTFCEQTLANNLHFSCVFGSSGFPPSCQLVTVLMLDGR